MQLDVCKTHRRTGLAHNAPPSSRTIKKFCAVAICVVRGRGPRLTRVTCNGPKTEAHLRFVFRGLHEKRVNRQKLHVVNGTSKFPFVRAFAYKKGGYFSSA